MGGATTLPRFLLLLRGLEFIDMELLASHCVLWFKRDREAGG